jgi:hypothetical protein
VCIGSTGTSLQHAWGTLDAPRVILRRPTYETVATEAFEILCPDGSIRPIQVRVGAPYSEDGHWACPVEVIGLLPRPADQRGESSVQALALGLARRLLQHEIERGREIRQPGSPDVMSAEHLQMLFYS